MRKNEFNRCILSGFLVWMYRFHLLRKICLILIKFFEKEDYFSYTMRRISKIYYGVEAHAYSSGVSGLISNLAFNEDHRITISRYAAIAKSARIFRRNHPLERLSASAFFYEPRFGITKEHNLAPHKPLFIGPDAEVMANAIITPGCSHIGVGAVVGCGSVVDKDVPDFAVVSGNPAKIVCFRFSNKTCEIIKASEWWKYSIDELKPYLAYMSKALKDEELADNPVLRKIKE